MTLSRFFVLYLVFNLLLGAIAYALPIVFPDTTLLTKQFWLVFGFLSGITAIAFALAYLGIKRSPETGIMAVLGSILLKLLFSMVFVLIYSMKHKESDLLFVFNFFSLYLLFTGFELNGLLRNLRHQNK